MRYGVCRAQRRPASAWRSLDPGGQETERRQRPRRGLEPTADIRRRAGAAGRWQAGGGVRAQGAQRAPSRAERRRARIGRGRMALSDGWARGCLLVPGLVVTELGVRVAGWMCGRRGDSHRAAGIAHAGVRSRAKRHAGSGPALQGQSHQQQPAQHHVQAEPHADEFKSVPSDAVQAARNVPCCAVPGHGPRGNDGVRPPAARTPSSRCRPVGSIAQCVDIARLQTRPVHVPPFS